MNAEIRNKFRTNQGPEFQTVLVIPYLDLRICFGFRISGLCHFGFCLGGLPTAADRDRIVLSSSMFVLPMHIFGEPIRCP